MKPKKDASETSDKKKPRTRKVPVMTKQTRLILQMIAGGASLRKDSEEGTQEPERRK